MDWKQPSFSEEETCYRTTRTKKCPMRESHDRVKNTGIQVLRKVVVLPAS